MKTREELLEYPVVVCVQLIDSKCKLLILRSLLARPWRSNELRKSLDGVIQKVLTELGKSIRHISSFPQ